MAEQRRGAILTVTQSGSQISGTQLCPGTTSLPGITINGTASADGKTAIATFRIPEGTGTFRMTLAADARSITMRAPKKRANGGFRPDLRFGASPCGNPCRSV